MLFFFFLGFVFGGLRLPSCANEWKKKLYGRASDKQLMFHNSELLSNGDTLVLVYIERESDGYSSKHYLLRISNTGEIIWVRCLVFSSTSGNFNKDFMNKRKHIYVSFDEDNIYVGGMYIQSFGLQFELRDVTSEMFIIKLSNDGDVVWKKTFGSYYGFHSWETQGNGNLRKIILGDDYILTYFYIDLNVQGGMYSPRRRLLITKFTKDGELIWQKKVEKNPDDFFMIKMFVHGDEIYMLGVMIDYPFTFYTTFDLSSGELKKSIVYENDRKMQQAFSGYIDFTISSDNSILGLQSSSLFKIDLNGSMLWCKGNVEWAYSMKRKYTVFNRKEFQVFERGKKGGAFVAALNSKRKVFNITAMSKEELKTESIDFEGKEDHLDLIHFDKDGSVVWVKRISEDYILPAVIRETKRGILVVVYYWNKFIRKFRSKLGLLNIGDEFSVEKECCLRDCDEVYIVNDCTMKRLQKENGDDVQGLWYHIDYSEKLAKNDLRIDVENLSKKSIDKLFSFHDFCEASVLEEGNLQMILYRMIFVFFALVGLLAISCAFCGIVYNRKKGLS